MIDVGTALSSYYDKRTSKKKLACNSSTEKRLGLTTRIKLFEFSDKPRYGFYKLKKKVFVSKGACLISSNH